MHRATTRRRERDYVTKEFGDWREIPSETLEHEEVRNALAKAVAALPAIYREVITLRDIRQFSIAETADILGIAFGNVKTRLARLGYTCTTLWDLFTHHIDDLMESLLVWVRSHGPKLPRGSARIRTISTTICPPRCVRHWRLTSRNVATARQSWTVPTTFLC